MRRWCRCTPHRSAARPPHPLQRPSGRLTSRDGNVQECGKGDGGSGYMSRARLAKFGIGQVVKHRIFPFRGVVFDVDPVFNNTEEWWLAIPEEIRPAKDQPYYHLFAENADSEYIAY